MPFSEMHRAFRLRDGLGLNVSFLHGAYCEKYNYIAIYMSKAVVRRALDVR